MSIFQAIIASSVGTSAPPTISSITATPNPVNAGSNVTIFINYTGFTGQTVYYGFDYGSGVSFEDFVGGPSGGSFTLTGSGTYDLTFTPNTVLTNDWTFGIKLGSTSGGSDYYDTGASAFAVHYIIPTPTGFNFVNPPTSGSVWTGTGAIANIYGNWATTSSYTGGIVLDSSNPGYIRVNASTATSNLTLTLVADLEPASTSGAWNSILSGGTPSNPDGKIFVFSESPYNNITASVDNDYFGNDAANYIGSINGLAQWDFVYSGTSVTIYQNGTPISTQISPLNTVTSGFDPLLVGFRTGSTTDYLNGTIYQIGYQNSALSPTDIQLQYNLNANSYGLSPGAPVPESIVGTLQIINTSTISLGSPETQFILDTTTYGFNPISKNIVGWYLSTPGMSSAVKVLSQDNSYNLGTQTALTFTNDGSGGTVTFDSTATFTIVDPAWKLGQTWTIEFWSKAAIASTGTIFPVLCQQPSNNSIDISYQGGYLSLANTISSIAEPTPGEWTHVALVSNAGTITVYYNGITQGTISGDDLQDVYSQLWVGTRGSAHYGQYFNGKLAGIRINSTALYSSNFIPNIIPTNTTGTVLLINDSNSDISDSSSNNFPINYSETSSTDYPAPLSTTTTFNSNFAAGIANATVMWIEGENGNAVPPADLTNWTVTGPNISGSLTVTGVTTYPDPSGHPGVYYIPITPSFTQDMGVYTFTAPAVSP